MSSKIWDPRYRQAIRQYISESGRRRPDWAVRRSLNPIVVAGLMLWGRSLCSPNNERKRRWPAISL